MRQNLPVVDVFTGIEGLPVGNNGECEKTVEESICRCDAWTASVAVAEATHEASVDSTSRGLFQPGEEKGPLRHYLLRPVSLGARYSKLSSEELERKPDIPLHKAAATLEDVTLTLEQVSPLRESSKRQ
jgi:hypothetical protein